MATNLDTLIAAIPTAEDGHVISRDFHNSLRAALVAIASQLSAAPGQADASLTFAPNFLPITDAGVRAPEWVLSVGIASKPGAAAKGWFPVQLPDGGSIKSMMVTGQRSGTVLSCQVRLVRQTIADATAAPMIIISLKNVAGQPFKATGEVSGASLPIIQDFQTVNNDKYQYFVVAELQGAATEAVVDLYAIQVAFATP
jgi:hypothetical protein